MGIIDTVVSALRSLTGGSTERSTEPTDTDSREGQVSVEHDPDAESVAADTSTEAAVKGTDPGDDGTVDAASDDAATDAAAAGTDAAASTGTLVDEDAGGEPAETVGQGGGVDVDGTVDEVEGGAETVAVEDDTETEEVGEDAEGAGTEDAGEDAEDAGTEEVGEDAEGAGTEDAGGDGGGDEPGETIKGIGPAYADRLETVGIETVGELAAADAAEVADGIDVSDSRVGDWIERARDAP